MFTIKKGAPRQNRKAEFFKLIKEIATLCKLNKVLIEQLEEKAYKQNIGWKNEAFALIDGLEKGLSMNVKEDSKAIISKIYEARAHLEKADGSALGLKEILLPFIALIVLFFTTTSNLLSALIFTNACYVILWVVGSIFFGVYAFQYGYKHNAVERTRGQKLKLVLLSALLSIAFTFYVQITSVIGKELLVASTKYASGKDWQEVKHNNDLFPFMKSYLKRNYDIDLVLIDKKSNGFNTYFGFGLSSGSPASMAAAGGFCELYYSGTMLDIWSNISSEEIRTKFHQVALAHEAGHCVSIEKDLVNLKMNDPLNLPYTRSIYLEHRPKIKDIESFIEISELQRTQLWREIIADVFAVGFAKFHYPADADIITNEMIRIRDSRVDDVTHRTSCWLTYAKGMDIPKDEKNLYEWSLKLASEASSCDVNKIIVKDN